MADGLGLQSAYGLANLQGSLRQRVLDQMAQQHQIFQDQLAARAAARADQQQQILMQEHAANLAERKAALDQAGLKTRMSMYAPGDVLSPAEGAGLPTTPQTTLPSTQMGGGMGLPASAGSSLMDTGAPDTSAPPTAPPSVSTSTPSPAAMTGKLLYRGTAEQRKQAEDEAALNAVVNDPNFAKLSPVQQFAKIRPLIQKGEAIPYQVLQPKDTTEPVMRVNPRTGTMEQLGAVPKGSHFVNEPPPPQTQTVTIQTVDDQGNPVTRVVPKTEAIGKDFQKGASAVSQNRRDSAKAVLQTGQDIIDAIKANAASLGPIMGRYNSAADFIGNPPPEFARLAGMIESYSLANMGVHGMRSANGADAIKRTVGLGRHTPESLISTLEGLNGFAQHFIENTGGGGGKKISVTAPDGSVHPFDTQAQADTFKKLAGIK